MDHGGEAARLTAAGSTELGMAGAVQGSEANIGSGAFDGQLGAAAAHPGSFTGFDLSAVAGRGEVPVAAGFHLHRQLGPGVAYANIAEFWRQPGPVDAVLVGPQLPDGVMPVYSVLQPRPGAVPGVVLVDLLPGDGGAVYNWDYVLQPRPGAGHGEVLDHLLRHGAGHAEVFVGLIPGGVDADNYGYYALQPRPGAGHGEVLDHLLRHGDGHGEVFVGLIPGGGGGAVHDDYGYYPWQWQPLPGVGSGEVFIGPLPNGVGAVFVYSGSFAQQTLSGTGRADGMAGELRIPNLGAGYDNRGMVTEHLRRLLPFVGIGASSVAVNGLAAGPGSPAVAFHLFVLLLGGLFLVILHVLRV